jgi:hypothetical protein
MNSGSGISTKFTLQSLRNDLVHIISLLQRDVYRDSGYADLTGNSIDVQMASHTFPLAPSDVDQPIQGTCS